MSALETSTLSKNSSGTVSRAETNSGLGDDWLARRFTSRDLVVTFFAYLWRNRPDIEVPGTFLVALMEDFSVAAPNTRATLRRLERDGLFITRRSGRNLWFCAGPVARSRAEKGVHRILNFGRHDEWSGVWTFVTFSIPEKQSHIRMALRDSLRLEGFAPYYDGVWIAPGDLRTVAIQKADIRGVEQLSACLVDNQSMMLRGRLPIESWDLDGINAAYSALLTDARRLFEEYESGLLSPAAALTKRTLLLTRYRRLVPADPGLPLEMMPSDWLRRQVREAVAQTFDALAPLASSRIEQLLEESSEQWAEKIRIASRLTLDELANYSPPMEPAATT